MKFTAAILVLASSASASLLQNARRLDENAEAENEYGFLQNYHIKMLSCKTGAEYTNSLTGEIETSSVVFRLCPSSGECKDESSTGCTSGYGDFVTGLNSFVQEYLEDKKEDMQNDDAFKVEQLGECRQFEGDKDGDADGAVYYIGPACSADGTGVRVAMFTEETCSTLASDDVTFEDISNGISLPYSDGGLVSNYCESCNTYNDKDELSEFCTTLYTYAGKCETNMETYHASGQQTASCEAISSLIPKIQKSRSGAGRVIGWLFFVVVAVGVGAFAFTAMKKKKDEKAFGLMT